jgi:hypothetical protein
MKKVSIIVIVLLFMTTAMNAQSKFQNFFGHVPSFGKEGEKALTGQWLPRPAFTASALQLPLGQGATARLVSCVGAGIGYALFQDKEGDPYQVVAFTLSVFVGPSEDSSFTEITPALGVTAWQYINFGVGYNFGIQKPVLLLNLTYSFN